MKIRIKRWDAVATWKWDTNPDDVCGICRGPFESACQDCKYPGDGCPIVYGECKHVFHMHCLHKWIASDLSRELCPMDRMPWKEAADSPAARIQRAAEERARAAATAANP
ncbi:anaphase-promoting complex subunit Apc11 [Chytridium lagenaria]|nr:anaphase-promoting complex subunit Apc11 [Chytridium lagenaria]